MSVYENRFAHIGRNMGAPAARPAPAPVQEPVQEPAEGVPALSPAPAVTQAPAESVSSSVAAPVSADSVPDSAVQPASEPVVEHAQEPAAVPAPAPAPVPASEPAFTQEIGQEMELSPALTPTPVPSEPASVSSGSAPAGVPPDAGAVGSNSADSKTVGLRGQYADKVSNCDIPKNIVRMVMHAIPTSKNRNDALAAFLYVALNREPVVSEEIKLLASEFKGDSEVANLRLQVEMLSRSLENVGKTFKSMETTMDQMMTMLVWLVGERMNASIDLNQPVAAMDFLFPEHEFVRRQAASQTSEYAAYLSELRARARYKSAAAARDARR